MYTRDRDVKYIKKVCTCNMCDVAHGLLAPHMAYCIPGRWDDGVACVCWRCVYVYVCALCIVQDRLPLL